MRKPALLTSVFVHVTLVGGAVWLVGDPALAQPHRATVSWEPSVAALPPTRSPDAAPVAETDPATEPELVDPVILETFTPPEPDEREPAPIEEQWLAKLRPSAAMHFSPPRPTDTPPTQTVAPTQPPAATDLEPPASEPPAAEAAFVEAAPIERANTPPSYPRRARRLGYEGEVWIAASVDADGLVRSVELAQPCPFASLNRAALRAVRGWRFAPARRGGVAVESVVRVPVVFRIAG